jgi:hypothetical protein
MAGVGGEIKMCETDPFPLKPRCHHKTDELDRHIMLLMLNLDAQVAHEDGYFYYQELATILEEPRRRIAYRVKLLIRDGWLERVDGGRLFAAFGATPKARERHLLWLWLQTAEHWLSRLSLLS